MSKSINQIKAEIEAAKADYHKAVGVLTALKEQAMQIPEVKDRVDGGEDLASALRSTIEVLNKQVSDIQAEFDKEVELFTEKYNKFLGGR
jgi:archaellum component FlaC